MSQALALSRLGVLVGLCSSPDRGPSASPSISPCLSPHPQKEGEISAHLQGSQEDKMSKHECGAYKSSRHLSLSRKHPEGFPSLANSGAWQRQDTHWAGGEEVISRGLSVLTINYVPIVREGALAGKKKSHSQMMSRLSQTTGCIHKTRFQWPVA